MRYKSFTLEKTQMGQAGGQTDRQTDTLIALTLREC